MKLYVQPNSEKLAQYVANFFARSVEEILKNHTFAAVALSGGLTPKRTLEVLAENYREKLPWNCIHFFWTDERIVPPDHPQSNFRMAQEAFFSKVDIPAANIHRIKTEIGEPQAIANAYEEEIREFDSRFDLVFLGLGEDGHFASIFPDSSPSPEILNKIKAKVIPIWVPHLNSYRVSISPFLINGAGQVVFVVSGAKKAKILKQVQGGNKNLPAVSLIHPLQGKPLWFIDSDAAIELAN